MTTVTPPVLEHTCEVALRPNDFDWAGHLNIIVYVQLLETGRWEWGLAHGVDAREDSVVAMVLQLQLDYVQSVDWDPVGRLVVRTSLADRSAYSFTLAQDVGQRVTLRYVTVGTRRSVDRVDVTPPAAARQIRK